MATTETNMAEHYSDERTKPPFLRRVRIRGYKSIAFCDVELHPLTILVGRNASGKSNFLDALAFLRDLLDSDVYEAVKRRGGWQRIRNRFLADDSIHFEIHAEFPSFGPKPYQDDTVDLGNVYTQPHVRMKLVGIYSIAVSVTNQGSPFVSRETLRLHAEGATREFGYDVPTSTASASHDGRVVLSSSLHEVQAIREDRTYLSSIGNQPYLDLANGLRWLGCYNFRPDSIRNLQRPAPGALLEPDGSNLASVIQGLREIDEESVHRIGDYLSVIVDEIESFQVVRYGEYETVRFRLRSGSANDPIEFDAASMSDGTLRTLAALVAAFQMHLPSGPAVVGIEEPETALHPAAMRALVDALEEATERTQIILTTHSADLLSSPDVQPRQVLVVRNRSGFTEIAPVDGASLEIIRRELDNLPDLQRQDQLAPDPADLDRQHDLQRAATNGVAG